MATNQDAFFFVSRYFWRCKEKGDRKSVEMILEQADIAGGSFLQSQVKGHACLSGVPCPWQSPDATCTLKWVKDAFEGHTCVDLFWNDKVLWVTGFPACILE